VASLAVLADESAEWRPNSFSYGFWGSETSIRFPVIKLTDYRSQSETLETSNNPFALATLAHLETQQTRKNAFMRFESKLRFTRSLYIRGWSRNKIIELFHFIDWIMQLPSELENKLWVEINKIEEEGKMPYISSVERIGYQRGWDKGKDEGKVEGKTEGRVEYIGLGLSLKFGDDASFLMASIREIQDPDRLSMIMNAIFTSCSIEENRAI
jgi:flagellar biosynthesis/type III secretory pathway protein FliH